ncbi:hypothetical protein KU73_06260 [Pectobacterium wasabiae]|uniref:Transposase n=1 Tax=Pectobacterium wasabiae TaxID=55208 RepID=A0AAW3ELQ2_9GAMM|nr:hypothetical protein A7983_16965 [Pectobacterium wasabiae CFBP 3304]EJS96338.1 Hypothetical protein Y17_0215 [Pectobacterium wasabiae CFBP 3304]KFX09819.1 hypothetical protein JV38_02535 [Pectobacterium wasabiae]KGA30021.1 hypothetical protein KU73_06260 [Pectobacterium wasabiae]
MPIALSRSWSDPSAVNTLVERVTIIQRLYVMIVEIDSSYQARWVCLYAVTKVKEYTQKNNAAAINKKALRK